MDEIDGRGQPDEELGALPKSAALVPTPGHHAVLSNCARSSNQFPVLPRPDGKERFAWGEQVEHVRQQIRADADPRVADPEDNFTVVGRGPKPDFAAEDRCTLPHSPAGW